MGLFSDGLPQFQQESQSSCGETRHLHSNSQSLASLKLEFTKQELTSYTEFRKAGLSKGSKPWMNKASQTFWNATNGLISKDRLHTLREYLLNKYVDIYAQRKVINFSRAFLKYLAQTRFDGRYEAFKLFLAMPKAFKERKHVTSRIVTREDIEKVLLAIIKAYENEEIDNSHYLNYKAIVTFGAFTGQRPLATIARLTVRQFKDALNQEKPVLDVFPEQDKIRFQHWCPLAPQVVEAISPLLDGRRDDQKMFEHLSFERWLRQNKIPLSQGNGNFLMGDMRKFCEQEGDLLLWDQSNKNYIMTHAVSGIDWRFYKSPRPGPVYDIYLSFWGAVEFETSNDKKTTNEPRK